LTKIAPIERGDRAGCTRRPGRLDGVTDQPSPAATGRVLVVEDERTLAGMVAAYLSRAGFETAVVHTGIAAVDAVRENEPDVVILDLGLPGLDGIEVCRQIRTFSDCLLHPDHHGP